MTNKQATHVAVECPTCRQPLPSGISNHDDEAGMFDVDEASCNDQSRKEASGIWLIEKSLPMLVAESWDEDSGYVQAIVLDNHDEPGFTIVEREKAEQLGKARVRVDDRDRGDLSAPVGQLYVRNGFAGISYLTGWHHIVLLQVALADADSVPDGDYGFSWSIECSKDEGEWQTVYQADQTRSWLNDWRPANERITGFLPQDIESLREGLIPIS
jgi:hypothetical protein